MESNKVTVNLEVIGDLYTGQVFWFRAEPDRMYDDLYPFNISFEELKRLYNNISEFLEDWESIEKKK